MQRNNKNKVDHTSAPQNDRYENHSIARGNTGIVLAIIIVILFVIGIAVVTLLNPDTNIPAPSAMPTAKTGGNELENGFFYDGMFVDDIPLGGLTREIARQQIELKQKGYLESTGVTIVKDQQSWRFTLAETTYSFDTEKILDAAWNQGRSGTDEEKRASIANLAVNPIKLYTTVTADPSVLEQKVRDLAVPFIKPATDAAYLNHDSTKPKGEHMSFTPDTSGEQVDGEELWKNVKNEFTGRAFGTVEMKVVPLEAAVKLADLQTRMIPIVNWRSPILDYTAPRLNNIKLASAAISGKLLQPGDELSFNDTTGERTVEKGYQEAGVITSGVPDTGLGGGVCQVSGTLWNAVVRADLEIVNRLNHSLKSSYLDPGEDATVDYGRKDFVFKNNKDTPVMVFMYVIKESAKKYYLYAEVYGIPLEPGVTIELESVRTKTVAPPSGEPRYVASNKVPRGKIEIIEAKRGEYYTTYSIYLKDGKETRRVKQHESYYPASGVTIAYNPSDGRPTPTPSPTPTPTPTPARTPSPSTPAATITPTQTPEETTSIPEG